LGTRGAGHESAGHAGAKQPVHAVVCRPFVIWRMSARCCKKPRCKKPRLHGKRCAQARPNRQASKGHRDVALPHGIRAARGRPPKGSREAGGM